MRSHGFRFTLVHSKAFLRVRVLAKKHKQTNHKGERYVYT